MTTDKPHPTGTADETTKQRRTRQAAQLERDLATLAAGGETGWWKEHGPAPWPTDYFDHDNDCETDSATTPNSTNL